MEVRLDPRFPYLLFHLGSGDDERILPIVSALHVAHGRERAGEDLLGLGPEPYADQAVAVERARMRGIVGEETERDASGPQFRYELRRSRYGALPVVEGAVHIEGEGDQKNSSLTMAMVSLSCSRAAGW